MKSALTVIIPTFNRVESLANCLDFLKKQTDKDFSVLVIDGGSTDKTPDIIKKHKKELKTKVIVDKTHHLSYIRDLGWRKAKGKIVAWIDDDVVVSQKWTKTVKEAFRKDDNIGGVTGPTVIPKKLLSNRDVFLFHTTKNPIIKLLGKIYFALFMRGERYGIGKIYPSGAWSPGSNFPSALKLKKPIKVDYLEACNFAVQRRILEEIDGFDLNYKGTSEWCEVDLSFRIRKKGYKLVFDPKAAVEHNVSSGGVFPRRFNTIIRLQNFIRFYLFSYYPKTFFGFLQFLLYVQFLSFYYVFLSFKNYFFKRQ